MSNNESIKKQNFFYQYKAKKSYWIYFRVFEVASGDLAGMGIVVISYTIKEIIDDVGYLKVNYTQPSLYKLGVTYTFL